MFPTKASDSNPGILHSCTRKHPATITDKRDIIFDFQQQDDKVEKVVDAAYAARLKVYKNNVNQLQPVHDAAEVQVGQEVFVLALDDQSPAEYLHQFAKVTNVNDDEITIKVSGARGPFTVGPANLLVVPSLKDFQTELNKNSIKNKSKF